MRRCMAMRILHSFLPCNIFLLLHTQMYLWMRTFRAMASRVPAALAVIPPFAGYDTVLGEPDNPILCEVESITIPQPRWLQSALVPILVRSCQILFLVCASEFARLHRDYIFQVELHGLDKWFTALTAVTVRKRSETIGRVGQVYIVGDQKRKLTKLRIFRSNRAMVTKANAHSNGC